MGKDAVAKAENLNFIPPNSYGRKGKPTDYGQWFSDFYTSNMAHSCMHTRHARPRARTHTH